MCAAGHHTEVTAQQRLAAHHEFRCCSQGPVGEPRKPYDLEVVAPERVVGNNRVEPHATCSGFTPAFRPNKILIDCSMLKGLGVVITSSASAPM